MTATILDLYYYYYRIENFIDKFNKGSKKVLFVMFWKQLTAKILDLYEVNYNDNSQNVSLTCVSTFLGTLSFHHLIFQSRFINIPLEPPMTPSHLPPKDQSKVFTLRRYYLKTGILYFGYDI